MEELKFLSAAGYSQMYGGAVIYEWRLDAVSLYSLKGIRL